MKIAAVIPARYDSSRFPGKPLADLAGKSLIQRVYEAVLTSEVANIVIVATDDQRIFDHVKAFGGEVAMTRNDHPSGTDRVAEVASTLADYDIIINVQGDEPFVTATQLKSLVEGFEDPATDICTLARKIDDESDLFSPNVVKVVQDDVHKAIYFSRQAIPFLRDIPLGRWLDAGKHLQHLGLYAFRRPVLPYLAKLKPGQLEQLESLEQLRWLEAGYNIHLGITTEKSIGVDTPADLEAAAALFK